MIVYSSTFEELIEKVFRAVHDWEDGTATGGTTTTLIDTTDRLEQDDYWNDRGAYLWVRSGDAKDDWRKVTDFVNSTSTLTVPTMTGTPASGDEYSLHVYKLGEVESAINVAIDEAAMFAREYHIDETVTLAEDIFEYNLPSEFVTIHRVTMADDDGVFHDSDPITPDQYTVVRGGALSKLRFNQMTADQQLPGHFWGQMWANDSLEDGYKLRIEGTKRPSTLSLLTDTTTVDPRFIVAAAAAEIHAKRIRRSDNEPDAHNTQYQLRRGEAETAKRFLLTQMPMNSKTVTE